MKKIILMLVVSASVTSCKKDENGNPCWTCTFQSGTAAQNYCGYEPYFHHFTDAQGNTLVVSNCKLNR